MRRIVRSVSHRANSERVMCYARTAGFVISLESPKRLFWIPMRTLSAVIGMMLLLLNAVSIRLTVSRSEPIIWAMSSYVNTFSIRVESLPHSKGKSPWADTTRAHILYTFVTLRSLRKNTTPKIFVQCVIPTTTDGNARCSDHRAGVESRIVNHHVSATAIHTTGNCERATRGSVFH